MSGYAPQSVTVEVKKFPIPQARYVSVTLNPKTGVNGEREWVAEAAATHRVAVRGLRNQAPPQKRNDTTEITAPQWKNSSSYTDLSHRDVLPGGLPAPGRRDSLPARAASELAVHIRACQG